MGLLEFFLLGQGGEGGNSDDIALHGHAQLVHFQHKVKHLIPGHRSFEGQGDFSGNVFVNCKVFAADFPQDPENIFNIGIKKIKGNFFPCVFLLRRNFGQSFLEGLFPAGSSCFFGRFFILSCFHSCHLSLFGFRCRCGGGFGQNFFPFRQICVLVWFRRYGGGRKIDPQDVVLVIHKVGNRLAQFNGEQRVAFHSGGLDGRDPIHRTFKSGGDQGALAIIRQAGIDQFKVQSLAGRFLEIISDRNRCSDDQG